MSLNQFMNENLGVIKDEIIKNIPNPDFDSHEFIRRFAKKFEISYIEFLGSYKLEPFRNVHAQIGRFLSEHQELLEIKDFEQLKVQTSLVLNQPMNGGLKLIREVRPRWNFLLEG